MGAPQRVLALWQQELLPAACATVTGCTMEDSRNRSGEVTEIAIVLDVNLGCAL